MEHAISRLKVVAALTKCLLGPHAFEFFRSIARGVWEGRVCIHLLSCFESSRRSRKASCSSVPNTGRSHWPNKLRGQPERRNDFEAGLMDSSRKWIANGLRFSCKKEGSVYDLTAIDIFCGSLHLLCPAIKRI